MDEIKIIECPRDAWQGLPKIIPADVKVAYLKGLLKAGFRHIDAVSFVSPKYVPQMADSEIVMQALSANLLVSYDIEIIGIVVNEQGFHRALGARGVTTIGYPYSLSERFSRQNANMSLEESRRLVEKMQRELEAIACEAVTHAPGARTPSLVVYVSMAFGNPYGDPWSPEMLLEIITWLKQTGIKTVSLADTVGRASAAEVATLFRSVARDADGIEIGLHLHSRREGAAEKVLAAYEAGCRRFDSALTGLGGCPFAGDELVGNIPTEIVVNTLSERGISVGICPAGLHDALNAAQELRRQYAN